MTVIEVVRTPALGDTSYLLSSGGEVAVVDPQRDAWPLIDACADRGLRPRFVLETHVHNDYVSGAREWQAATGATVAGPARAGYAFPHLPLADGDELSFGGLSIRALATPGHTPEHTSYLVTEDGAEGPTAVLTGGSLIVGGAGRTDLMGAERADELTRAQCRSLRRLLAFDDAVRVLPTHGSGSFCTASARNLPTSTLGDERRTNPAVRLLAQEDEFVRARLAGLPRFPAYYRHMAGLNRAGAPVLGGLPGVAALDPAGVERAAVDGAWVVDARDREGFAAAHLPGSVNVELDAAFATYVGWVVPFAAPLVLVLPEPTADAAVEARTQLLRTGYDRVVGALAGGPAAWRASGRPLASYPAIGVGHLPVDDPDQPVLDVRQPAEVEQVALPGSRHVFLGDLPERLGELPRGRRTWVVCASGRRAAVAASLLDRAGLPVGLVARGGVADLAAAAA
ncbi:MBL fold metallo-hydrolase [Geodermatophilus sp. YIM 151500]|uniref:MBL fold metallo-hydrolase n=1 Tax=Geodermatophilus sp. YIM 151500 TaxID=2984531 RepID=UPI0021E4F1B0|nr:MBL fold metallo-hydrolase [Geodermatophilus sp. YIM 151500]MCV2490715.1 MBL fold metallo-hydrolase [Geodermatophilus sp. YIM 151500]